MGLGDFFKGSAGGIVSGVGSLIGGAIGAGQSSANASFNYDAQKEFAQNGIRWRVEDAKRAGIHPLYALGASTKGFSPVSSYGGDFGISDAAANFGQGLDRAAQAKMTKEERLRVQAAQERQEVLQLADYNMRRQESDARTMMYKSEALRNFAASKQVLANAGQSPAMPSLRIRPDGTVAGQTMTGQGDSAPVKGLMEVEPSKGEANAIDSMGTSAASVPDIAFSRTNDGGYALIKSDAIADRLDDDFIGSTLWYFRNSIPAALDSPSSAPPKSWLPKGASSWVYNWTRGAWYPDNSKYARQALKLDWLW